MKWNESRSMYFAHMIIYIHRHICIYVYTWYQPFTLASLPASTDACRRRTWQFWQQNLWSKSLAKAPVTNLDILHLPDILTVSAFGPCRIPGIRVLDTLRIDTTPEFPAAPLFPWDPWLMIMEASCLCSVLHNSHRAGSRAKIPWERTGVHGMEPEKMGSCGLWNPCPTSIDGPAWTGGTSLFLEHPRGIFNSAKK